MTHDLLRLAHWIGVLLMGGGLLAVFVCDLRGRLARERRQAAEMSAAVAVLYDGLVVPGALVLLTAGAAMVASAWGPRP